MQKKFIFRIFPGTWSENGRNIHEHSQRLLGLPVISLPHPERAVVCFGYDYFVIKLLGFQFGV